MKEIIKTDHLIFDYPPDDPNQEETPPAPKRAVDGVTIGIEEGSFTAIIGPNGSGKSTLARNFNGLLLPTEGAVFVDGMDTRDPKHIWDIRQTAGMVFQNPDNQLVSSVVEDDVAFGPENLGIEPAKIRKRVDKALAAVNMTEYRYKAPHLLSGGQKQRVAIAGILAMTPRCIIMDEPTAMLDPSGRAELMKIIGILKTMGITIVLITHFMEEAVQADRIIVMVRGKVSMDGSPEEVFADQNRLRALSLDVPMAVSLADGLRKRGIAVPSRVITPAALTEFLCQYQ